MNGYLNPVGAKPGTGRVYKKQSDLTKPSPVDLWVFIDESPGSVNDGGFFPPNSSPANPSWTDIPAGYHNGSGGLSFADGHAEHRKWTDPLVKDATTRYTLAPWTGGTYSFGSTGPDALWLGVRSSAP